MNEGQETGLFWLPSNPDEEVVGTITLDDANCTILRLDGQLGPHDPGHRETQTIHGALAADRITLLDCIRTNSRHSFGRFIGSDETTWHCQFAFRGDEHIQNVPDRIKSVATDIELLGDWTPGFRGIQMGDDRSSISWPASQPDLSARWDLGTLAIHQEIRNSWEFSRFGVETATISTYTSAHVGFNRPQTWGTTISTMQDLQALISIAKGEAVNVRTISLVQESAPDLRLGASFSQILNRDSNQLAHSELFTMQELGGIEGVARWLNVLHGQDVLINALLAARYRQPSFVTDRTSHLLTACEAYQRHRMKDRGKRINNLGEQILAPMLRKAGRPFAEWVGEIEDWKHRVSAVRNDHGVAHLQGYASASTESPDFHLVNQQLYILVVLCLLAECGVPAETLSEVVDRMRSCWKIRL